MPFKLSPDIAAGIAALASDVDAHLRELAADFVSRGEDWRVSAEGHAARRWINSLRNLKYVLDTFPEKPEG